MNRRTVLQLGASAAARWTLSPAMPSLFRHTDPYDSRIPIRERKLIVVQFGGGARLSETITDPTHQHIPFLWNDLVPLGSLFTNMRVEGAVVHPNSTGSLMTGHWEWKDFDWSRPLAHPTLFEIYRRAFNATDLATWAFVYASILARTSECSVRGYGPRWAANVVVPPTIPRWAADEMDRRFLAARITGTRRAERKAAEDGARLARSASRISYQGIRSSEANGFLKARYSEWKNKTGTVSHDAFLAECAAACMKTYAPDVMSVCFGEIDCAHYGSWSRYVEAIKRTDQLVWNLWQTVQTTPAYKDRTLMLILPDHGRELDSSSGLGFVHHSDFYSGTGADEGCRRVWMLALGPGVSAGARIDKPIPITGVAATALEYFALSASEGAAPSVWRHMTTWGGVILSHSWPGKRYRLAAQ